MLRDITLGQYVPVKSPLHSLNPPLKIILTILYITALFIIKTPPAYAVFTVYTLLLMIISSVPVKIILRGIKPMLWILVFTAILNIFMTPGKILWSMPVFGFTLKITYEGLTAGAMMVIRLLYLLIGTSLLTLTTSPLQLTDGIELLLRPLNKIKVPSHEIAMMMTIAIRFIPTLAEETDKIMKAQTARGADFETGNIIKRARAMLPLLVPLFISAFRRADELASAMEARCYGSGAKRTRMKEIRVTAADFKAAAIFAACVILLMLAEFCLHF